MRRRWRSRRSIGWGNSGRRVGGRILQDRELTADPPTADRRLERNIVVRELPSRLDHVLVGGCAGTARLLATAAACAHAAAAQQHDTIAADLGGVPLVAVLVVPLPRLQPALDVNL